MSISVICTVKNGETTISQTIQSVLEQTNNNFEVIVVDDGSTDNTAQILERFRSNDNRIKIITTSGVGRSNALNLAVQHSKGEWIANIDADDLWHPQKLEIQEKFIKKNPGFFLVGTNFLIIYDDEIPKWMQNLDQENPKFYDVDDKILITNPISHPSVIMNKEKFIEIGGYDKYKTRLVDYDLWLRAYKINLKMGIIELPLVAKRIHKNQSFENKKRISYIFDSSKLQMKHIISNRRFLLILIPIIKFIVGLFPFRLRNKFNNIIKKYDYLKNK